MNTTSHYETISQALEWLVALLKRHEVPYQIVGGLAAQAYGAERPLVDIDLYVPMELLQSAMAELSPYLIRNARPTQSAFWRLTYLALDYHGAPIQIADSTTDPRFYNRKDQRWEPQIIDYAASQRVTLYGVEVDVMPREELLRYKALLDREVDRADIQALAPGDAPGVLLEGLPRTVTLTLDLETFDFGVYDALIADLEGEGFRFTSMEALGNTEAAQRQLYALNDRLAMEEPGSDGEHAWATFEDFREDVCRMAWYKPGGQIVALDTNAGNWVAMSAITRFEGHAEAYNLVTGVEQRYRGRQLALAVLALALRYARDVLHAQTVRTDESARNAEALALYNELGYREASGGAQG
ncbi:MAG: hypothetical protein BWY63_02155 [Chloroflexi bacterium ADurb.Bin360]|nr:MAG: hypothetical protein BWY63_02155 [Chloroflexi bacterium ADurb.Bin360]